MRHDPIDPGLRHEPRPAERRMPGRVRDRMSRPVVTVRCATTAGDAWKLMKIRNIRHLPVLDEQGRLVGILTDRDLRQLASTPGRALMGRARAARAVTVAEIMTRRVITAWPAMSMTEAARLMNERRIGSLPVVEDDRLVGMLTESDVLEAFAEAAGEAGAPSSRRSDVISGSPAPPRRRAAG